MADEIVTTDYTLIIDGAAVDEIIHSPTGPVFRYIFERGQDVQDLAKVQVGKRTGRLADSIVKRFSTNGDGVEVLVGSDVDYARLHHDGTRPHEIVARRAETLTFFWPKVGAVVHFPRVHHPGTKPNHYLTDPLHAVFHTV
jgi:hypothetical protein